MENKYKYSVVLRTPDYTPFTSLEFDDYDSVQNIIGYMVEGSRAVTLTVYKEPKTGVQE